MVGITFAAFFAVAIRSVNFPNQHTDDHQSFRSISGDLLVSKRFLSSAQSSGRSNQRAAIQIKFGQLLRQHLTPNFKQEHFNLSPHASTSLARDFHSLLCKTATDGSVNRVARARNKASYQRN